MYIKKISILFIIALFLSSIAFGQTVTINDGNNYLPLGAYANGSDGDQYFWVEVQITVGAITGAYTDGGTNFEIQLPEGCTVPDVDEEGDIADEIAITASCGAATGPLAAPSYTSGTRTIAISFGSGSSLAQNDEVFVLFPITTPQSGTSGTFTVDFEDAAAEPTDPSTVDIEYLEQLDLFSWHANYSDGDKTSEKGDVYPTGGAANTFSSAALDLIKESGSLANDFSDASDHYTPDASEDGDEVT